MKICMKIFLIFCFAHISLSPVLYADDAQYQDYGDGEGADVYPLQNNDIQLVSETIAITDTRALKSPQKKHTSRWVVDVDMEFKNHGDDTTVQMGFPIVSEEHRVAFDPQFRTWVNGKEVSIEKKRAINNPVMGDRGFPTIVYTYKVHFKRGETKNIFHSYGVGEHGTFFKYVLRTGALWKDSIQDITIFYKTHVSLAPKLAGVYPREHAAIINGDELFLQWKFKNHEPASDLTIFLMGSVSEYDSKFYDIDGLIKDRSPLLPLSCYQIYGNDKYRLIDIRRPLFTYLSSYHRLIRNKIFASYGYPFKNPYIRSMFYYPGSRYKEDPSYSFDKLSQEHRLLLNYISRIEQWSKNLDVTLPCGDYLDSLRKIESDKAKPLFLDYRNKRLLIPLEKDIIFISLEDYLPVGKLSMERRITSPTGRDRALKSPNGKFLAINDDRNMIYVINLDTMELVSSLKGSTGRSGQSMALFQFSGNSDVLYTLTGAYDLITGAEIKRWTIPPKYERVLSIVRGIMSNGNLLCVLYYADKKTSPMGKREALKRPGIPEARGMAMFAKSPSNKTPISIRIIRKLKTFTLDLASGKFEPFEADAYREIHISPDGRLLAGVNNNMLKIWRFEHDSLHLIYEKSLEPPYPSAALSWGRDSSSLFLAEAKLWRYDIASNGSVSEKLISTPGNLDGTFDLTNDLVRFKGKGMPKYWDIKTGKKILPFREVIDPFDKAGYLPLYE